MSFVEPGGFGVVLPSEKGETWVFHACDRGVPATGSTGT